MVDTFSERTFEPNLCGAGGHSHINPKPVICPFRAWLRTSLLVNGVLLKCGELMLHLQPLQQLAVPVFAGFAKSTPVSDSH